jgi:hypothetical protein
MDKTCSRHGKIRNIYIYTPWYYLEKFILGGGIILKWILIRQCEKVGYFSVGSE